MGTGEGATVGPDLPLAEAVVTIVVADLTRMEPPVCWGFFGQSLLVAVYDGSQERLPWGWGCGLVSSGVQWH